MEKFDFDEEYYLTNYNELVEYLNFLLEDDKNKKIKYIFTDGGFTYQNLNVGKKYELSSDFFIVFDNDTVLKINYNFYGLMYIKYMWIQNLNLQQRECNKDEFKLDLEVANSSIESFYVESFSEAYEINAATGTMRPEGDYFKKIELKLSNQSYLCICPEDAEFDGYCEIWTENDITRIEDSIFNDDETANANWIKEWSENHLNNQFGDEVNGLIPFNVQQFNEFCLAYHHDLMSFAGLWGFMDKEGNVIVEPRYLFEPMEYDGLYIVCEGTGWVHTPDLPDGKIWSNIQKWGVIDKNQNVIIPIEYDQIDYLYADNENDKEEFGNLFTVFRHQYKPYKIQEVSLFNSKGEQIIPFIYNDFYWSYLDGQLVVYKGNNRYGDYADFVGYAGIFDLMLNKEIIAPNKYKDIDYIEKDLFVISDDFDNGMNATIINKDEEIIGKEKIWHSIFINENTGKYRYKGETMDGKYWYFNIKDKQIVDMIEVSKEEIFRWAKKLDKN